MNKTILAVIIGSVAFPSFAKPRVTQNDFGGVGLLQTPIARMAAPGSISFNANRTEPYTRYSISLQPFEWMEGTFRYTSITNRDYGSEELSGDQSYKDKAIDLKIRLLEESRWIPELAIGGRDIGGTGLFSSEYIVASKRMANFDFSFGLGWGYMAHGGSIKNPFSTFSRTFEERGSNSEDTTAGELNSTGYFRGPMGFFGGVVWQTPWEKWLLKVEYDGNDYESEPQDNDQPQNAPINLGFVFKANDWLDIHAALERGNTAMFGITIHSNLASRPAAPKIHDPTPEPISTESLRHHGTKNWADVSQRLEKNAGFSVEKITKRDREVVIYGAQTRYFSAAKGLGRAARILDNSVGEDIDWLTWVNAPDGIPVNEISLNREAFRSVVNNSSDLNNLLKTIEHNPPNILNEEILHENDFSRFGFVSGIGYKQSMGGPDNFIIYQISYNAKLAYRLSRQTSVQGSFSLALNDNFDEFEYTADSKLPRVRTNVKEYWTESDFQIPSLTLTHAFPVNQNVYGVVYGGYLESMFAGLGGELMLRPVDRKWAIGADLNFVRQRGFKQDFSLRDYETLTGHVTGYFELDQGILLAASVGRYLARDIGGTLDISREFSNGSKIGAWATITDVSSSEFGEGSFDKGIYFSIPFDEIMTTSTRERANFVWSPLTRDGGARLARPYSLYNLTEGRSTKEFYGGFHNIIK